jgi:hypothetical protein
MELVDMPIAISLRIILYGLLFNCFYFVAIADVTSLAVLGGNVRLAWILIPFLYCLIPKGREPKYALLATAMLFIFHMLASIMSESVVKGVIYSCWIWVNYIFFRAAYILTHVLRGHVWSSLLWGGRVQIVFAIVMVLFGFHERAQFIYFEPSYLAIGLVPYIFVVIFWSVHKWIDAVLLIFLIVFNQSANMMLAMIVAAVYWLITNRKLWLSFVIVVFSVLLICILYQIALADPSNPNHAVVLWFHVNGLNYDFIDIILSRGGNRMPRMQAALEVLEDNWFFGFGPGSYLDISASRNFDHITNGIEYLDPAGLPVINVLIESVANAGIFAALVLVAFIIFIYKMVSSRVKDWREKRIILGALLTICVLMQFESSYLRAYLWFICGVFMARSINNSLNIIRFRIGV